MEPPSADKKPRTRAVLLIIAGVIAVLCIVFGVTVVQQKTEFEDYRRATLDEQTMPWTERAMTVDECVDFTVAWSMDCPGVGSWCSGHGPRLTLECLGSTDRHEACAAYGEKLAATSFGYQECEQRRESVEGRYAKRAHKKFCAANYRAVAEYCKQLD